MRQGETHVRIFEDRGELTIEIEPIPSWAGRAHEALGPVAFTVLAIEAVRTLLMVQAARPPFLVYMLMLVFALLAVLSVVRVVWILIGAEDIVLRGGLLTVNRRVWLLAFARTYRVSAVRDIHASFRLNSRFHLPRGRLAFRYEGRTRYMADRIDQNEAKKLVQLFRDWLPRDVWTPVLGL